MDISKKLNAYIETNNLTATKLAASLNVAETTVRNWLHGAPFVRLDTAELLIKNSNGYFSLEDFFDKVILAGDKNEIK